MAVNDNDRVTSRRLKQFWDIAKTWIREQIVGSKANWNENDSSADGYVQNRTHWVERTPIEVGDTVSILSLNYNGTKEELANETFTLFNTNNSDGNATITEILKDNIKLTNVQWQENSGVYVMSADNIYIGENIGISIMGYFGELSLLELGITGNFIIMSGTSGYYEALFMPKSYLNENFHKLDKKYLPETEIVDWEAQEGAENSILNKPFGYYDSTSVIYGFDTFITLNPIPGSIPGSAILLESNDPDYQVSFPKNYLSFDNDIYNATSLFIDNIEYKGYTFDESLRRITTYKSDNDTTITRHVWEDVPYWIVSSPEVTSKTAIDFHYTNRHYNKLDPRYIPDSAFERPDWNSIIKTNQDYIVNKPFGPSWGPSSFYQQFEYLNIIDAKHATLTFQSNSTRDAFLNSVKNLATVGHMRFNTNPSRDVYDIIGFRPGGDNTVLIFMSENEQNVVGNYRIGRTTNVSFSRTNTTYVSERVPDIYLTKIPVYDDDGNKYYLKIDGQGAVTAYLAN